MKKDVLSFKRCMEIKRKNPNFYTLLEGYLTVYPDQDKELIYNVFLNEKGKEKDVKELEPYMTPVLEILEKMKSPGYQKRVDSIKKQQEEEDKKYEEKIKKQQEKLLKNKEKAAEKRKQKKEPKAPKKNLPSKKIKGYGFKEKFKRYIKILTRDEDEIFEKKIDELLDKYYPMIMDVISFEIAEEQDKKSKKISDSEIEKKLKKRHDYYYNGIYVNDKKKIYELEQKYRYVQKKKSEYRKNNKYEAWKDEEEKE
jgi:hypothetical protein